MPNYIIVIPSPSAAHGWSLLRAGVPLSLICDLAHPDGPPSREILTAEAVEDDVVRAHPRGRSIELPEVTISTA
ncbi:MAG TPA: hypothetical protein VMT88_04360 [Actinomycetes bacterium]|nr:hypothetical protein [Actinomycetes bacterium]